MPNRTPRTDRRTALLPAGALALASLLGFLALAANGGDIAPRLDQWYLVGFVGLFLVGATLVPAIPVYLFVRHGVVSPIAVLVADVVFWLVAVPTVGTTDGSTILFTVLYWPVYVALYAVAAGVEHRFRTDGGSPAPG